MTPLHACVSLFCLALTLRAIGSGDASMAATWGFFCGGNLLRAIDLLVKEPRCN